MIVCFQNTAMCPALAPRWPSDTGSLGKNVLLRSLPHHRSPALNTYCSNYQSPLVLGLSRSLNIMLSVWEPSNLIRCIHNKGRSYTTYTFWSLVSHPTWRIVALVSRETLRSWPLHVSDTCWTAEVLCKVIVESCRLLQHESDLMNTFCHQLHWIWRFPQPNIILTAIKRRALIDKYSARVCVCVCVWRVVIISWCTRRPNLCLQMKCCFFKMVSSIVVLVIWCFFFYLDGWCVCPLTAFQADLPGAVPENEPDNSSE